MKDYTDEEKAAAFTRVPKSLQDFITSEDLPRIYLGLRKKHELDLRQLMVIGEMVYATLLGLEPETTLETNIHQWLHELSNEKARELVADINDRIFKEAKRRVRENIVTPEKPWDEKQFGPRDEFYRKLQERARQDDREIQKAIEEELKNPPPPAPPEDEEKVPIPRSSVTEKKENIISDKLSAPAVALPTLTATRETPPTGIQLIEKKLVTPSPVASKASALAPQPQPTPAPPTQILQNSQVQPSEKPAEKELAKPPQPSSPSPRLKGDEDPYRENVE